MKEQSKHSEHKSKSVGLRNGATIRVVSTKKVLRIVYISQKIIEYMRRFQLQSLFVPTGSCSPVSVYASVFITSLVLCLFAIGNSASQSGSGQYVTYSVNLSPSSQPSIVYPESSGIKEDENSSSDVDSELMELEVTINTELSKPTEQLNPKQPPVEDMEEPEIVQYPEPIPMALLTPLESPKREQQVVKIKQQPANRETHISDNTSSVTASSPNTNSILSGASGKMAQTEGSSGGENAEPTASMQSTQGQSDDGPAISSYWLDVNSAIARNLHYPLSARNRGVEGLVKLKVTINAQGKLIDVSSVTSLVDDSLRNAAIKAVYKTAPFLPPVAKNITAGLLTVEIPVRFELSNEKGREAKM